MGKLTISGHIFHGYVNLPEGIFSGKRKAFYPARVLCQFCSFQVRSGNQTWQKKTHPPFIDDFPIKT